MMALAIAPAEAVSVTAHTNRGGTCHLRTHATRTGSQISYGVKVSDCSTHFGVRYVVSQGALYDQTAGTPVKSGFLKQKQARVPYVNQRTVKSTNVSHTYRTKIDVSIVLKSRRNRSTPHPEKWLDPGKHCRVTTTKHNGDTLGCKLGDTLKAA
jgi:hypothetical protein